nr:uncharacterized protein LOC111501810 [Leptinotarsa decemlineata]
MNFFTKLLKLNTLNVSFTNCRTLQSQKVSNILPVFTQITNAPNPWIYQQNDHVKLPLSRIHKIELPNNLKWVPPLIDPVSNEVSIEPPVSTVSSTPLSAIGITVIRRKKMKKHKLRKLRKRMKFEWAKKRQRREWRKEKLFQAKLIQQCKEAESFSAEKYVQERIDKWKELTQNETSKGPHQFLNKEMKQ